MTHRRRDRTFMVRSAAPASWAISLVISNRSPLFADAANVQRLRQATAKILAEMPFDTLAAVVLPDHLHFV